MSGRESAKDLGNRRTHRRAELRSPVLIDASSSYFTGRCRDVSEAGLGVELSAPLPVGMNIDVYFELPTGVAVEARAEVARWDGQTAGIHFCELSSEGSKALRAYCDSWRRKLLANCAERAESAREAQPEGSAALYFPPGWAASTEYDASETQSGVRIRVADELPPDER